MTKIANNLKFFRESQHITQKELAEKIKVSNKTISHWESGYSQPSIDQLIMLADILDITIDELVGRNS